MYLFARMFATGAIAAALLGAVSSANGQDTSLDDVQKTPASIHKVVSGGHWLQGDTEGFFRVVLTAAGVEHVPYRLYIQWIRIDTDTQGYQVIRTTGVKEVNDDGNSALDMTVGFPEFDHLKIVVKASRRAGGPAKRLVISVKGTGPYRLR
jgi:hypothetical protein